MQTYSKSTGEVRIVEQVVGKQILETKIEEFRP
jgi:hypothetical protein